MTPKPDPSRPQPSLMFKILVFLFRPFVMLMTKRTWRGAGNLPEGGFVAVSNHISDADPLTLYNFLIDHGIYPAALAKQELFSNPLIARALRAIGAIPVDRDTPQAHHSLREARAALEAGTCVVVYPEATHTFDPDLWPMTGKTGAVRLAMTAGVPVVPIAQWGPQQFRHPHTKRFWLRRFDAQIVAGEPIYFPHKPDAALHQEEVEEATAALMLRIADLLSTLRGEPAPEMLYERGTGMPADAKQRRRRR
ncbi:MAG TPA: lysophospholipid acyltransferase family protein [Beutenbergiaceae bacterium]|nr:lysophospholipid acyltransferase family protein [Beutenbergiaceae bacterium]